MRCAEARGLSAALAFFWAVLFFGIIDLTVVFDQLPDFYESYLLETGWGVLYTWLVAAPLVVLTVRPTLKALLIQIATVGACVAVTAHAATAWGQLLPAAALLATAAAVHALVDACGQKTDSIVITSRLHWPVLLIASAGASAGAWLATTLLVDLWQRRPPVDDITLGLDHWPMQAALALALPAVAGVCSLQTSGWRFSLGTVIVGSVWWGAVSLVYPDHAGSLGTTGGWLAITWSIALGITSCLPSRPGQSRTDHPDGHDARHSSVLAPQSLEGVIASAARLGLRQPTSPHAISAT